MAFAVFSAASVSLTGQRARPLGRAVSRQLLLSLTQLRSARRGAPDAFRYSEFAEAMTEVGSISGRKDKLARLAEMYRDSANRGADDLKYTVKLSFSHFPGDQPGCPVKFNIGEAFIRNVVESWDPGAGECVAELVRRGEATDIGSAVRMRLEADGHKRKQDMSVAEVYDQLLRIAEVEGKGSVQEKMSLVSDMILKMGAEEATYLVRTMLGKGLKVGVLESNVSVALSVLAEPEPERRAELEQRIRSQLATGADLDRILDGILSQTGEPAKGEVRIAPTETKATRVRERQAGGAGASSEQQHGACSKQQYGVPITPMAALAVKSFEKVVARFAPGVAWLAQWKYDGERVQIHARRQKGGRYDVTLFSRNRNDMTFMYPDIKELFEGGELFGAEEVQFIILDAEVVAVDPSTKRNEPFQALLKRPRKKVPEDIAERIPVRVYLFDCIWLNEAPLMQEPLRERMRRMRAAVDLRKADSDRIAFAKGVDVRTVEELSDAVDDAVKERTEGVIVKDTEGTYKPGKRNISWWKAKKDYLTSTLYDSIDVVVIGFRHGKGKRAGGPGSFLVAVPSRSGEDFELQTLCFVGTGVKEECLENFGALDAYLTDEKPEGVLCPPGATPDVWIREPEVNGPVWEVRGADLCVSPTHSCCHGFLDEEDRPQGISLRFPRKIRERPDKSPCTATTAPEVKAMFDAQVLDLSASGMPKSKPKAKAKAKAKAKGKANAKAKAEAEAEECPAEAFKTPFARAKAAKAKAEREGED